MAHAIKHHQSFTGILDQKKAKGASVPCPWCLKCSVMFIDVLACLGLGLRTFHKQLTQVLLDLCQVLLLQVLEEVRFLRLEKQDFSLRGTSEKLESASEAQNTSAESYHRVLNERSKSGMAEHIEIDNQSISQPCQARIPRQLRSSHSCHKIHKYRKS